MFSRKPTFSASIIISENAQRHGVEQLEAGDILIDGGNSYYVDDIKRAKDLAHKQIHYVAAILPAQAQVDPARVQLLKHHELLDDSERRVIGKHYATGADAQARGSGSYVCNQDSRRGAGQPGGNAEGLALGSNRSIPGCGRVWRGGADRRRHPA